MKARLLPLVILTGALSAVSVPAQDDAKADTPAPAADKSGQLEKRRQEMLARFDANGDGVLDDQEKAVMRATLKKEKEAAKVSGSGDVGSLSAGEAPAAPGVDRFVLEIIKRFDKDGDGKLDATELAAFLKSRGSYAAGGQQAGAMRAQMMKMFDKNGDGVLDAEERAEMEKFRDEQIKRFDKNGDGVLDAEERAEAMKAFMADHPELAPAGK
jgi:Ca2+-binding EF-hand superfamily protein